MENKKVEPTFVGENDDLVFVVPKELFTMKLSTEQKLDRETIKEYSKYLTETFKGFQKANKTKYQNGDNNKTETTPEFWIEFENLAKEKGIELIGYTPVLENYIFKNLPIVGKNAIIFSMEMDWDKIKTAPSVHVSIEAFRVYYDLGEKNDRINAISARKRIQDGSSSSFWRKALVYGSRCSCGVRNKGAEWFNY